MNKLINKHHYLLLGLCLIFPINNLVATILLIILGVLSIFLSFKNKLKFETNELGIFNFFFGYIALLAISIFRNDMIDGDLLHFLFPMFFIPFVFLTIKRNKFDFILFHYAFIGMSFFILALTSFKLVVQVNSSYSLSNYVYSINEILWLERPYMGFFLHLGLLSCLYVFEKNKKIQFLIFAILILLFNIIIASKLALLLNVLAIFIYVLRKNVKWIFYTTMVSLGFIYIFLNTSMSYAIKSRLDNFSKHEPRTIIWRSAAEIFNESGFNKYLGFSNGQIVQGKLDSVNLLHRYERVDYYWVYDSHYNTHNQFLYFLLSYGYIGLGMILFISFFPLYLAIVQREMYCILLSCSFILFMAVENLFSRQFGIYSFLILTSFIFIQNQRIKLEK